MVRPKDTKPPTPPGGRTTRNSLGSRGEPPSLPSDGRTSRNSRGLRKSATPKPVLRRRRGRSASNENSRERSFDDENWADCFPTLSRKRPTAALESIIPQKRDLSNVSCSSSLLETKADDSPPKSVKKQAYLTDLGEARFAPARRSTNFLAKIAEVHSQAGTPISALKSADFNFFYSLHPLLDHGSRERTEDTVNTGTDPVDESKKAAAPAEITQELETAVQTDVPAGEPGAELEIDQEHENESVVTAAGVLDQEFEGTLADQSGAETFIAAEAGQSVAEPVGSEIIQEADDIAEVGFESAVGSGYGFDDEKGPVESIEIDSESSSKSESGSEVPSSVSVSSNNFFDPLIRKALIYISDSEDAAGGPITVAFKSDVADQVPHQAPEKPGEPILLENSDDTDEVEDLGFLSDADPVNSDRDESRAVLIEESDDEGDVNIRNASVVNQPTFNSPAPSLPAEDLPAASSPSFSPGPDSFLQQPSSPASGSGPDFFTQRLARDGGQIAFKLYKSIWVDHAMRARKCGSPSFCQSKEKAETGKGHFRFYLTKTRDDDALDRTYFRTNLGALRVRKDVEGHCICKRGYLPQQQHHQALLADNLTHRKRKADEIYESDLAAQNADESSSEFSEESVNENCGRNRVSAAQSRFLQTRARLGATVCEMLSRALKALEEADGWESKKQGGRATLERLGRPYRWPGEPLASEEDPSPDMLRAAIGLTHYDWVDDPTVAIGKDALEKILRDLSHIRLELESPRVCRTAHMAEIWADHALKESATFYDRLSMIVCRWVQHRSGGSEVALDGSDWEDAKSYLNNDIGLACDFIQMTYKDQDYFWAHLTSQETPLGRFSLDSGGKEDQLREMFRKSASLFAFLLNQKDLLFRDPQDRVAMTKLKADAEALHREESPPSYVTAPGFTTEIMPGSFPAEQPVAQNGEVDVMPPGIMRSKLLDPPTDDVGPLGVLKAPTWSQSKARLSLGLVQVLKREESPAFKTQMAEHAIFSSKDGEAPGQSFIKLEEDPVVKVQWKTDREQKRAETAAEQEHRIKVAHSIRISSVEDKDVEKPDEMPTFDRKPDDTEASKFLKEAEKDMASHLRFHVASWTLREARQAEKAKARVNEDENGVDDALEDETSMYADQLRYSLGLMKGYMPPESRSRDAKEARRQIERALKGLEVDDKGQKVPQMEEEEMLPLSEAKQTEVLLSRQIEQDLAFEDLVQQRERRQEAKRQEEQRRLEEEARVMQKLGLRQPNKPLISDLSTKWMGTLRQVSRGGHDKTWVTCNGLPLTGRDLNQCLLDPGVWLNDNIMVSSIAYVADYVNKAAKVPENEPKCAVFTSFFYQRLLDHGVKSCARVMKAARVRKDNFLRIQTILIPICSGAHWTLAVVRPGQRTVSHMDSVRSGAGNKQIANVVLQWVAATLEDEFNGEEWQLVDYECPKQHNTYDCGVFTITNALCVALGLDPVRSYSANQLSQQRRLLAAVLLNKGYTGEFSLDRF